MDVFKKIGIGVDIETIRRFKKLDRVKDRRFLDKIFTDREIDYCFAGKNNTASHLAARFAGKEAVIKALSSLDLSGLTYEKIEIINNRAGVPLVKLKGRRVRGLEAKISLSHCQDKAIAFAVVRKE